MIDIKQFDDFGREINDYKFKTISDDRDTDDQISGFFVDEEDDDKNPKQQFVQQLGDDFEVYKKAVEEYMTLLQKPSKPKTYKADTQDFSCQTDYVYQNFRKKQNEIGENIKNIDFLNRETNIMMKVVEKRNAKKYSQEFNCFLNMPTKDFEIPNIYFQSQNCVQVLPHFDFARFGQIGFSKPAINYLFTNITNKANEEHMEAMASKLVRTSRDERDSLLIIYGDKGTAKKEQKNLIVTNVFEFLTKDLLKGIIGKQEQKLTVLVKDFDCKMSELWLKSEGYEEQIDQQLNALFPKMIQRTIKEKVDGKPAKCVFIELSKITEKLDQENLSFLETATDKICGIYIITQNKLIAWPKKRKSKPKPDFVDFIIQESIVGTKGTPVYRPLKKLLKVWKTIPTNVIITLNPEAMASRRVYETILSCPDQNIISENGVYSDLLVDTEEIELMKEKEAGLENVDETNINNKLNFESVSKVNTFKKESDTLKNRNLSKDKCHNNKGSSTITTQKSSMKTSSIKKQDTTKIPTKDISKILVKKGKETPPQHKTGSQRSVNKISNTTEINQINTIYEEMPVSTKSIVEVEDEITRLQNSIERIDKGKAYKTTTVNNEVTTTKSNNVTSKKTTVTSSSRIVTSKKTTGFMNILGE